MPFRLAGAAGVVVVGAGFALGFGAAAVVVGAGVEGSSSIGSTGSTGSPIEIPAGAGAGSGTLVTEGSTGGSALADALGVPGFGSSVETAITAAAVSRTTTTPTTAIPIRAARLAFFGSTGTAGRLRIGARPALMSWAV